MTSQRVGWVLLIGAALSVGLGAWLWVPWGAWDGVTPAQVTPDTYFDQDFLGRAEAYSREVRGWNLTGMLVQLTLMVAVLGWPRLRARLVRVSRGPSRAVGLLSMIVAVATVPFAALAHQVRRQAGVSVQSWPDFAQDVALSLVVQVVGALVVLIPALILHRRLPRAWPAAVALWWAGLVVASSLIYPIVVEPLFAEFTPVADQNLVNEIDALAQAMGVDVEQVLVADASQRTNAVNAYVSGLAGTRRVVLYDTAIRELDDAELRAVVAHELAHAAADDVWRGTGLAALAAIAAAGALGALHRRRDLPTADYAMRLLALSVVVGVFTAPVSSGVSRAIERQADALAAEQVLQRDSTTSALVRLQVDLTRASLADPTPPSILAWWFGTHPTPMDRIGFAEGYRSR